MRILDKVLQPKVALQSFVELQDDSRVSGGLGVIWAMQHVPLRNSP